MNRVILIGEGSTAETALKSLSVHHDVCAVFRNAAIEDDPVAAFAAKHSIPLFRDTTVTSLRSVLSEMRPACVVISSYGRIIRPELLQMCPFINVHYGPLPQYRGRANVNWAIVNKEPEAAITIHCVDPGLDSGNILFQRAISIGPDSTVTELYERLNALQFQELGSAVTRFLEGDGGRRQEGIETYCCTRIPADGEINWGASTSDVYALIRALTDPFPGAYTFYQLQRITIVSARPVYDAPTYVGRIPGRVCGFNKEAGTVDVLTGDGVLRIYEIQDNNGTRLPAGRLIRSTKDTLGLFPRDLAERIQQLQQTVERLTQALS